MATILSNPTTVTVAAPGSAINKAADWVARSTSPGVVWAENWSAYSNAQQAALSPGYWGSNTPTSSSNFPNVFQIVTDPGHTLSGKALRVKWAPGAEGNWMLMLGGNKNNIRANYYTKFYVQMVFWVGGLMDYSFKENGGGQGTPKLCIVDYHNSSSNAGEFVLTHQDCKGFITAYTRHSNGASNLLSRGRSTPFNSSNFQMQNGIDRGTALSDQASYERRYGPFAYGMTSSASTQGSLSAQGTPDPDAKVGGAHWNLGGLSVLEVEVQLSPNRARYWWAPYNPAAPVAPILVGDTSLQAAGEVSFGTRNDGTGTGWSGLQLTNFTTNSASSNNPSENWTDWAELVFSTQPIPFPGGLALP